MCEKKKENIGEGSKLNKVKGVSYHEPNLSSFALDCTEGGEKGKCQLSWLATFYVPGSLRIWLAWTGVALQERKKKPICKSILAPKSTTTHIRPRCIMPSLEPNNPPPSIAVLHFRANKSSSATSYTKSSSHRVSMFVVIR